MANVWVLRLSKKIMWDSINHTKVKIPFLLIVRDNEPEPSLGPGERLLETGEFCKDHSVLDKRYS